MITNQIDKFGLDWLEGEERIGIKLKGDDKVMAFIEKISILPQEKDIAKDKWILKCEDIELTPYGKAYIHDSRSQPYVRFSIDEPEYDQDTWLGRF